MQLAQHQRAWRLASPQARGSPTQGLSSAHWRLRDMGVCGFGTNVPPRTSGSHNNLHHGIWFFCRAAAMATACVRNAPPGRQLRMGVYMAAPFYSAQDCTHTRDTCTARPRCEGGGKTAGAGSAAVKSRRMRTRTGADEARARQILHFSILRLALHNIGRRDIRPNLQLPACKSLLRNEKELGQTAACGGACCAGHPSREHARLQSHQDWAFPYILARARRRALALRGTSAACKMLRARKSLP